MPRIKKRPDRVRSSRVTFACFPHQLSSYWAAAGDAPDGPLELSEWIRDTLDAAAARALRAAKANQAPAPQTAPQAGL